MDAPDTPGKAPLLTLAGKGRGAAGRRSRTTTGEPVDAKPAEGTVTDLALAATLRAAAIHGGPLVPYEHIRSGREGNLIVFCVDASGSMGARRRMAQVKAAVLGPAHRRLPAAGQGRARHVPRRRGGRPARADEQRRTRRRSAQNPADRREDAARARARADRADHPHRATPGPVPPRARDHRHRRPRRRPRPPRCTRSSPCPRPPRASSCSTASRAPVRLGLAAQLAQAAGAQILPLEAA